MAVFVLFTTMFITNAAPNMHRIIKRNGYSATYTAGVSIQRVIALSASCLLMNPATGGEV